MKRFCFLTFSILFLSFLLYAWPENQSSAGNSLVIEIHRGWNLISPGEFEIEFSKLKENNPKCKLEKEAQQWTSQEKYERKEKIEPLEGYWIYANFKKKIFGKKTCSLEISGKKGKDTYLLHKYWNMIASVEKKSFNEIQINCTSPLQKLWWYDPKINKHREISWDTPLEPGRGYWVWVEKDCQIGKGVGPPPPPPPITNNCPVPGSIPPAEQNEKKFDWRCQELNGKLVNVTTPPKDQRPCGACWAFGTIATVEGQANVEAFKKGGALPNLDLSEQYVTFCSGVKQPCDGGDPLSALTLLKGKGAPPENCAPYNPVPANKSCDEVKAEMEKNCPDWEGQLYKIDFSRLSISDSTKIAKLIRNHGPVLATVYRHPTGVPGIDKDGFLHCSLLAPPMFSHAVSIVGYNFEDPDNKYWILKGSWGRKVGFEGYYYLKLGEPNCSLVAEGIITKVIPP